MSRVRIFSLAFGGKPVVKGPDDSNGSQYKAPGVKKVSRIVLVPSAMAQHWELIPAGDSGTMFFIRHCDTLTWAFAPEHAHDGSFVLLNTAEAHRSLWEITQPNTGDDTRTIHLKNNPRLMWGLISGHDGSEVQLRTDADDKRNQWVFGS